MKRKESKEAQIIKYNMRKLKMEYEKALETDYNWDYIYNSAGAFFKELMTMERDLLSNDKEFLRNLDKMITIYQEARERAEQERLNVDLKR